MACTTSAMNKQLYKLTHTSGLYNLMYDRKMSMKIKGKVYSTLVRVAYDTDTLTLKKAREKILEVAEMRMLRWMFGVYKA